ncbi:hypothetical protein B0A52_10195 [Exophiala mesophila]|uniref:ATP-dependent DNA helicase n=1 Tax=Exophiala mesophila TaxID=212818 RepID=A0A438MTE6_EXOME|nr:hypothetical protein B0A52_10195 [Exophiala mesophila]
MDFIDDEAESTSESEVLVPSSQTDDIPRSRKRRRIDSSVGESDYDLPSSYVEVDELNENLGVRKSKYEDHIHVPLAEDQAGNTFVTQLTQQQFSSPSRIRGPRWMKPKQNANPSPGHSPDKIPAPRTTIIDEFDDDDDDDLALLEAFEIATATSAIHKSRMDGAAQPSSNTRAPLQKSNSFRQTTLHGLHTTQQPAAVTQTQSRAPNWPMSNRNEPPTHHQINREAMKTWVYPTNLGRIRDYQYNIVHKSLFNNLLVALPTGLGKTFIAATVMLNWFRWTKEAQIVFVAPTKPLVAQQIDACFNIAGIPRSTTTMLTGEVSPALRAEEWQEKRVFFMTPQTLINDLKNGMCDPKKIVLVVVDEAHKATGNFAYVEVVKFLRRYNSSFRVLALTATPGSTVEAVQAVIDGLGIGRVEIRTEESLDIRPFVHSKNVQLEVFDYSDEITMALEMFSAATRPLMTKLCSQNAYWSSDPEKITLFGLKKAWDDWSRSEAGRNAGFPVKGMLRGIFTPLMSLAHNLELLKYHGIGPFFNKMRTFTEAASSGGKYHKQLAEDENLVKLMNRLRSWMADPDFVGHPKLSHLKTVVLNHFMDAANGQSETQKSTRIMIFTHYRDSAEEIVRVLKRHQPMIKPHVFVGQSGTKGSEGMDQKTQLDIVNKFKAGTINTIVATSIGEEGLDIGEVDMIVCYDCHKSPIRMLQRMGRTGRKRAGIIVLLLMRGKEENDYYKAKDNYEKIQGKIEDGRDFQFHEDLSPRIVPKDIVPVVDKCVVEIPVENTQGGSIEPRKRKPKNAKKPAKKFNMPDGVETGFAFLGNGKFADGKSKREPKIVKTTRDIEIANVPPMKEVLLTEAEEMQLELQYVRVAGTADQYTQRVRMGEFPHQQRRLGKTDTIRHSRTTKRLVQAFKKMTSTSHDWERPSRCDVFDPPQEADSETQDDSSEIQRMKVKATRTKASASATERHINTSRTAPSSTKKRPLSQIIDDYEDEDEDDLDGFIVDDDYDSAEQPTITSHTKSKSTKSRPNRHSVDPPLIDSQESIGFHLGDDMPDLAAIMTRRNTAGGDTLRKSKDNSSAKGTWRHAPPPGRSRRIVDSDDVDEED